MSIEDKKPVVQVKPKDELHTCPGCGYSDGFHVSFKKAKSSKSWNVILICPQCHKKYQIDWNVNLGN